MFVFVLQTSLRVFSLDVPILLSDSVRLSVVEDCQMIILREILGVVNYKYRAVLRKPYLEVPGENNTLE